MAYILDESGEYTGLNIDAISMVIDFAQSKNRRECKANVYDAFPCEIDDRTYLCWTLLPKISCVIEYSTEAAKDADIFRIAESILLPFGSFKKCRTRENPHYIYRYLGTSKNYSKMVYKLKDVNF